MGVVRSNITIGIKGDAKPQQNGLWHVYEGRYCPQCHSRRIHQVDKPNGKMVGWDEVEQIWKCRRCDKAFKEPLIVEYYGHEDAVNRMHFSCPSYRVLMGKESSGEIKWNGIYALVAGVLIVILILLAYIFNQNLF